MRSDKYLWNICMEIYRKMYKEASPQADFDNLIKIGITEKPNWFMKYYLSIERQEEILNEICNKYKCTKPEKHKISKEIYLGCSPNSKKGASVV